MKLAAIHICENSLPHIFGKNHKELTLNFGGEYIYKYIKNEKGDLIKNKKENKNYIKNFFGKNIELISAIVGANGTGKTTIIDLIKKEKCEWIIEDEDKKPLIVYYTPFIRIEDNNFENIEDISKYIMMERDAHYERMNFSEIFQFHNSEKTKRFIRFMERKDITLILSDSLPHFDKVTISYNYLKENHNHIPSKFRLFFDKFYELENNQNNNHNGRIILELRIIGSVIHKVHRILERSRGKYLNKGYMINNLSYDSPEFSKIINLKDTFYYFLDNAYIQPQRNSEKILFPKEEIKELIELLLNSISEEQDFSDSWGSFDVDFNTAIKIIETYNKFLIAFREDFNYDKKALLGFKPNITLSSGEEALFELFSSLNDLKYRLDNKIDYNRFEGNYNYDNFLILLDEADLGFHPLWKIRYINTLLKVIPKIFPNKKIQIIFTTHDPLSLSDIPSDKIVYLNTNDDNTVIETGKKSFGANINDLLSDAFYVKDNLMGDFAKEKIEEVIKWINETKEHPKDISIDKYNYYKQVISIIDEPIINIKLAEMLEELTGNNTNFQKEMIQKEIDYLNDKKNNL